MAELFLRMGGIGVAWAVFLPFWLLTLAVLVWGRAALSRDEIRKAMGETLAASVALAFPATAIFTYCADFNPNPVNSSVATGVFFSVVLLPVYSGLIACAAFEFAVQNSQKRGAPRRPLPIRIVAGLLLTLLVMAALVVLATGCLLAAGPKALG